MLTIHVEKHPKCAEIAGVGLPWKLRWLHRRARFKYRSFLDEYGPLFCSVFSGTCWLVTVLNSHYFASLRYRQDPRGEVCDRRVLRPACVLSWCRIRRSNANKSKIRPPSPCRTLSVRQTEGTLKNIQQDLQSRHSTLFSVRRHRQDPRGEVCGHRVCPLPPPLPPAPVA